MDQEYYDTMSFMYTGILEMVEAFFETETEEPKKELRKLNNFEREILDIINDSRSELKSYIEEEDVS